ncbi:dihydrofolate reductase family protein [Microbacterium pygmaeum]|uniref:RibD C-terminal domain-containing protein n=1 Tax=Microbacterium pygmaeum TaxID=370764 RepID=A0A1G8DDB6_9MICO|nr:dihydrofolate reductase family protein [Microbacterium pygmaeum]SDH55631.1 RibD C-terminal domain-containing protein [Microbacterium pygmaeum]
MGRVVSSASMSLDGFVASPDNDPGALFDWYEAGDVEIVNAGDLPPFHLTRASADYWQGWVQELGCLVVGRLLFDITDGWKGEHPLGVPFVVLAHEVPTDWAWAHTGNGHFVTDGIEAAIARAQELAGDRSVGVAAGTVAGQALAAGLLDEVAIDLVPIVLGEGHAYFADVDPAAVRLGDPTTVIPSARVTHLRYPVLR